MDSTVQMAHSASKPILTDEDEIRELMTVWPDIVRDITDSLGNPDVSKWMTKVLQYNVPGGRKDRFLLLMHIYKILVPSDQLTEENIRLARILGWCVELVQAFVNVTDDIMDRSLIRRNQPSWYRHNDLNLAAINDGILLENVVYLLIKKYFKGKECYVDLLETFQNCILTTAMGQCLDLLYTNFGKKPNLDLFTMDRYHSIVNRNAAHSFFVLPINAAIYFAGIKDSQLFKQCETILFEIGPFLKGQDDYLAWRKIEIIGKDCTDIEEGKCVWPIVVALERATPEQRKILEECYGESDPEKVQRVNQLYNDLDLPNIYSIYDKETYNLLNIHIQQIPSSLLQDILRYVLHTFYRRIS